MFRKLIFPILVVASPSLYAATFDVSSLADNNNNGSLRWAITQANAAAGPHTITFSVQGTISLNQALPTVTRSVTFDGSSAPGYTPATPSVMIQGNGASTTLAFQTGSDNSAVVGLAISNGVNGIEVTDVDNFRLADSFIGMALNGNAAAANTNDGVRVVGGSGHAFIDNVLSGNGQFGLRVNDAFDITIQGNKVGTNQAGTAAVGNGLAGIQVANTSGAQIGGTGAGEGNVISGNGTNPTFNGEGLRLQEADNVVIEANIFGGDVSGTQAIPNRTDGIYATGVDGTNTNRGADNHLIGGSVAGRNYFVGNGRHGLFYEYNTNDITITHNYVGIGVGGALADDLGNGENGISIENGASNVTIGGTTDEGNVVSNNGRLYLNTDQGGECRPNGSGIKLNGGADLTGTVQQIENAVVQGNIVGLDPTGSIAAGNTENGITATQADGVQVGGLTRNFANTVSSNGNFGRTPCGGDPTDDKIKTMNIGQAVVINFSHDASVVGNYLGTDINGEGDYGNTQSGVIVIFSDNVEVGSDASEDGGNIIANNAELGVHFVGGNDGTAFNNVIGLTTDGQPAGNGNGGIFVEGITTSANMGGISGEGQGYTIGGDGNNQPNIIANSTGGGSMGVGGQQERFGDGFGIGIRTLDPSVGHNNTIGLNEVYCNAGLGVALNFAPTADLLNAFQELSYFRSEDYYSDGNPLANQGNAGRATPKIDPVLSNRGFTAGTTDPADAFVDLYYNPSYAEGTSCDCEAEQFMGRAVANGGTFEFDHTDVPDSAAISVIGVDANGNSSQASVCCRVSAGELAGPTTACEGDELELTLTDALGNNVVIEMSTDGGNNWTEMTALEDVSFVTEPGTTNVTMPAQAITLRVHAFTDRDIPCDDYSEPITINPLDPFTYTIDPPTPVCEGGEQQITLNLDGSAPFVVVINDNGTEETLNINAASETWTFTEEGTFEIVSIQDNACTEQVINESSDITFLPCGCDLSAEVSGDATVCEGESADITFTIAGEGGPYTLDYTLNGNAVQEVVDGPTHTINVSESTEVTLDDVNSDLCDQGTVSGTATVTVEPCCELSVELTGGDNLCEGETAEATFTFTGVDGPYTLDYTINGQAVQVIDITENPYIITIEDDAALVAVDISSPNCALPGSASGTAEFTFVPCCTASAVLSGDVEICPGGLGSIYVTLIGEAPFSITVTGDSAEFPMNNITDNEVEIWVNRAGIYTITQFDDAINCQDKTTAGQATVSYFVPPVLSTMPVDPLCPGSCDGSIEVQGADLTGYQFFWSQDGTQLNEIPTNVSMATDLCDGEYTVNVITQDGCDVAVEATLTDPDPLVLNMPQDVHLCPNEDAEVEAPISGGTPEYTFTWSTGASENPAVMDETVLGRVTLNVTDANGCEIDDEFEVTRVGPMTIQAILPETICPGASSSATVTPGGGALPYVYTWNNGADTETASANNIVQDMQLSVTVTDQCNQQVTAIKQIGVHPVPGFKIQSTDVPSCGIIDYEFTLDTLPDPAISCAWSVDGASISGDCTSASFQVDRPSQGNHEVEVAFSGWSCPISPNNRTFTSVIPYGPTAGLNISSVKAGEYTTFSFSDLSEGAIVETNWEFDGALVDDGWDREIRTHELDEGGHDMCIEVIDSLGCEDVACDQFEVEPILRVWIANAFTPEKRDGHNDEFGPVFYGIPETYTFLIFDRWGDLIFKSEDHERGWDGVYRGQMSKSDVYTWKMLYTHSSLGDRIMRSTGKVTIVL